MRRIVMAVVLLACSGLQAQQMKTFVVAQRREGVIEFIDPVTLATVSRIHFDVRSTSGLNGVAASRDGARLYVEGPITGHESPGGCCYLYSIDLAALQAKKVAGIGGTHSQAAFVVSNGIVYQMSEIFARGGSEGTGGGVAFLDPTGHYLFRVRSSHGPALDVYDLAQGTGVRRLAPTGLDGQWFTSGAWSGNRFFLYATRDDGSAARLWTVSATAAELGPGVAVKPFGQIPGCSKVRLKEITAAGGNLFVYERFGTKLDRREFCGSKIPGGAWVVDPDTGQLLHHYAPELHFAALIADRTEPVLYGLAAEGSTTWKAPVKLVRTDARSGRVLQSRYLDVDYWWITVAPLQKAPTGEVQVVP
jgi:hypothetical protein